MRIEAIEKIERLVKSGLKTVNTDDSRKIIEAMCKARTDVIVIDDFQGILVSQFMGRAKEKGYQKYTDMAKDYWDVIKAVQSLPPEKRVYFMSHLERDQNGCEKIKTLGKLLDEKVTVEGLFTIVLKAVAVEGKHYFHTRNSGSDTVKSPMGMFAESLIPNCLAEVDKAVRAYYGIGNKTEGEGK